MTNGSLMKE